ncbi:MAG: T9SS type A sorting domain-containing protein [Reichenbachiella sp.]|uniref:T9SS type A sorting domain-containing protein n=1 Tax=Reichenbachiella sp. TaxID=2184521 RepID=UPI003262FA6E
MIKSPIYLFYLVLSIFLFTTVVGVAQTTTAQDGTGGPDLWTSAANWDNGVPDCASHTSIVIPNGVTIIIRNTTIDLSACDIDITIESGGTLRFGSNNGNTSSLVLSAASSITLESGAEIEANTLGTSTGPEITINIGGNETWDGSDGDIIDEGIMDETTTDGSLPIGLLSFEGVQKEDHILVSWATAWEENNDYFALEKSLDGVHFSELQTIVGAGNSLVTQYYTYQDELSNAAIVYYRLRQIDYDGKFEEFEAISVRLSGMLKDQLMIYPNPTDDFALLTGIVDELSSLKVYDLSGTQVYPQIISTASSIQISFVDLLPGSYILRTATQSLRIQRNP